MFPVAPPPLPLPSPPAPWASECSRDSPVRGQRSHVYGSHSSYNVCTFSRSLRSPISIFSLRWALLRAARQRDSLSLSAHAWLVSHVIWLSHDLTVHSWFVPHCWDHLLGGCQQVIHCVSWISEHLLQWHQMMSEVSKWYLWCQVVSVVSVLTNSS